MKKIFINWSKFYERINKDPFFKEDTTQTDDDNVSITNFNSWLSKIVQLYGLSQEEIGLIIKMYSEGKTLDEIIAFAQSLQQEHQQRAEKAKSKIVEKFGRQRYDNGRDDDFCL